MRTKLVLSFSPQGHRPLAARYPQRIAYRLMRGRLPYHLRSRRIHREQAASILEIENAIDTIKYMGAEQRCRVRETDWLKRRWLRSKELRERLW